MFETSPKLSEVNLASNAISRLNDGTFGHLTSLSLLDLSHNSLMRIEDNVFVGMNISHLDLGYNNLRKMPSLPLRKLTAARTLILDGNPLHFLGKFLLRVVIDRNSVLVNGIGRKYRYWYQSQKNFWRNRNSFFSNFTHFFHLLGGIQVLKA